MQKSPQNTCLIHNSIGAEKIELSSVNVAASVLPTPTQKVKPNRVSKKCVNLAENQISGQKKGAKAENIIGGQKKGANLAENQIGGQKGVNLA